jgi:hypothetical protein
MNAVAADEVLNQAVADLSTDAFTFLCAAHAGEIADVRATADIHMHRLRALVRETGADLDAVPAYKASITNWRAVARLAGSVVEEADRAG